MKIIKFKTFAEDKDTDKAADLAKMKIDREKKADAAKHDRMMDRARTLDTKVKNKATK